ncbi:hypothetical protein [Cumulibacter soli]|uniref:hypothetical protein n=1 Tax=Cumulibacter soli TaxID=2546344 RepID=UPI00106881F8|nr:hypothetical protein [Cumulibacter soli]
MSTLTNVIPASQRKVVYAVFAVIGVLLGAVQVAYGAADTDQPTWLIVTWAVYGFLSGAVGATAGSNTPADSAE